MLTTFLTGLASFFRGEFMRGATCMSGFAAFAASCPSFLGGEFVSFTLGVRGTSTFGGNFPLLGGVHRCKTTFAGLGLLIWFSCHNYFSKDCFIGATHRVAATDFNKRQGANKADGGRHVYFIEGSSNSCTSM
jgi:hypothetical protein